MFVGEGGLCLGPAGLAVAAAHVALGDSAAARVHAEHGHLDIEDQDVLPLFWRHYTAAEYGVVFQQAVKKGKKTGLWFVAPFSVDCSPEGPARDDFLASVPGLLRLLHRLVRPSYDRLDATALGTVPVDVSRRR
ncbi:MAG: hypothetical protein ABI894_10310 [Ilumatobacteraceae bacterium]